MPTPDLFIVTPVPPTMPDTVSKSLLAFLMLKVVVPVTVTLPLNLLPPFALLSVTVLPVFSASVLATFNVVPIKAIVLALFTLARLAPSAVLLAILTVPPLILVVPV